MTAVLSGNCHRVYLMTVIQTLELYHVKPHFASDFAYIFDFCYKNLELSLVKM